MVVILPATPLPQSSEGFYSSYNPFQTDGPKGCTERKMIGLRDIFVRTDLPGAGQNNVRVTIDDSKKGVIIKAEAPSNINDSSRLPRIYETCISLYCDCCEVSSVNNPQVTDGVLRLLISTTPINIDGVPGSVDEAIHRDLHLYDTDPNDPEKTDPTERRHPGLTQGPDTAYEYKQLSNGSAYVRLDMPGVPDDDFITYVETWRVNVVGKAPLVGHDSSGRSYSADAALLDTPAGTFPTPRLRSIIRNGVMRLFIRPA